MNSFDSAAKAFRRCLDDHRTADAFEQAARAAERLQEPRVAAVAFDNAARHYMKLETEEAARQAAACHESAATNYSLCDEGVRSGESLMSAAKALERVGVEEAERKYLEAAQAFSEMPGKETYATRALKPAVEFLVKRGRHGGAMRVYDHLMRFFAALQQTHNVHRSVLARVVLLLHSGDTVAAQREYDASFDVEGFITSREAAAAEALLQAANGSDPNAMKSVQESHSVLRFVDPPIARLVKSIPVQGVVDDGAPEAGPSSEAVSQPATAGWEPPAGEPETLELGEGMGSMRVARIGGRGEALGMARAAAEDPQDAARAQAEAQEAEALRAELFSAGGRPGRGGGGGAETDAGGVESLERSFANMQFGEERGQREAHPDRDEDEGEEESDERGRPQAGADGDAEEDDLDFLA